MWVKLNEEGIKVWGDVFPDGKVPVTSTNFHDATLQGIDKKESVILVNWNVLSSTQQEVILAKISNLSGRPKTEISYNIKRNGLPLRECYTTGVVAAELRFFI